MIYSAASSYAIRAMSQMAQQCAEGEYVILDTLCDEADLPRAFVAKIFQVLVRRGLLVSAKGRHGGFALARRPEEITFQEIVQAVDGPLNSDMCIAGHGPCGGSELCGLHDAWEPVRREIASFLAETTLAGRRRTARIALAGTAPAQTRRRRPERRDLRIPA